MVSTSNIIEILDLNPKPNGNTNFYSKYQINNFIQKNSIMIHPSNDGIHEMDFSDQKIMISDGYGWTYLLKIKLYTKYLDPLYIITLKNDSSVIITKDEKLPIYNIDDFNIGFHGSRLLSFDLIAPNLNDDNICNYKMKVKRNKIYDKSDFVEISKITSLLDTDKYDRRVCEIYTLSNTYNLNGVTMHSMNDKKGNKVSSI